MDELRLSRSLVCRAPVPRDNGELELPAKRWEGIADLGLGPAGGDDGLPELMMYQVGVSQSMGKAREKKGGRQTDRGTDKERHISGRKKSRRRPWGRRLRLAGWAHRLERGT